jgi:5-methylcytosine-specific restriction endonuclease McrA
LKNSIPSHIEHQVHLRDQHQCAHKDEHGMRCAQRRWLEIHHTVHFSLGGESTLENLITLCSGHHKMVHHRAEDKLNAKTSHLH